MPSQYDHLLAILFQQMEKKVSKKSIQVDRETFFPPHKVHIWFNIMFISSIIWKISHINGSTWAIWTQCIATYWS